MNTPLNNINQIVDFFVENDIIKSESLPVIVLGSKEDNGTYEFHKQFVTSFDNFPKINNNNNIFMYSGVYTPFDCKIQVSG